MMQTGQLSKILFALGILSTLTSCIGGERQGSAHIYDALPYHEDAHPNLNCALLIFGSDVCTLKSLPLIGMETRDPNKSDISKRMLVSHTWMGDRFLEVLDELPDDIKLLLRSVTAIVIDDDIRPSFYFSGTGAIYLDPASLWLSKAEKKTISDKVDYRSDFANELRFVSLWRYLTPEGLWARPSNIQRKLDDLVFPMAQLLYHELGHANDFLPPASHNTLDENLPVYKASAQLQNGDISTRLNEASPLQSDTMKKLAQVMFRGKKASDTQKSLSAAMVGDIFSVDVATDDYAYISYDGVFYEDTAMLFEELMLKYHFNYNREIGYTTPLENQSNFCGDYIIQWGQKGRLGEPAIKSRALFVASRLLPEVNLQAFVDALEMPDQSPVGLDWCEPFRVAANLEEKPLQAKGMESETPFLDIDISPNRKPPHP